MKKLTKQDMMKIVKVVESCRTQEQYQASLHWIAKLTKIHGPLGLFHFHVKWLDKTTGDLLD
jgi:hypothetical protein